jgi:hypothetical protein
VVACLIFIYMKIFVCLINKLACLQHTHASYVVYANAHSIINSLYHFYLYKIFVCLIKQACLLAIISKFEGGGTIACYGLASLNINMEYSIAEYQWNFL